MKRSQQQNYFRFQTHRQVNIPGNAGCFHLALYSLQILHTLCARNYIAALISHFRLTRDVDFFQCLFVRSSLLPWPPHESCSSLLAENSTNKRPCVILRRHAVAHRQYGEGAGQVFLDGHDCASVVELPAVVRSREQGDERSLVEELVAVLNDLVSAHNQTQVVLGQESVQDVCAKVVAHAAIAGLPTVGCLKREQSIEVQYT